MRTPIVCELLAPREIVTRDTFVRDLVLTPPAAGPPEAARGDGVEAARAPSHGPPLPTTG